MLSLDRVRDLLKAPGLSDKEAEEVRDHARALVDLIFAQWRAEQHRPHADTPSPEEPANGPPP